MLREDPYYWKWVLIAIHNAAQGFMVLALWQGNGFLTLPDRLYQKWYQAYRNGMPLPPDRLDKFMNLYRKVKDSSSFHTVGTSAFAATLEHDRCFELVNSLRNNFIHFTPKGWSLGVAGLPSACIHILDLVEFFGWKTTAVLWHDPTHRRRAEEALDALRQTLLSIASTYESTANR